MTDNLAAADSRFLRGRTALVTGGCSGIGLASARSLAQHGASVAVGSRINRRDQRELSALRDMFSAFGPKCLISHLDVCDGQSVESFIAEVSDKLGPVDILVNSAGITAEQGVTGHPESLWNDVIDTNLTGPFRLTRAVLPGMIERGWGRVINIGSTAATVGSKDSPAYCASKAGLLGLTRCVALEGAPHGVSCVMLSPTWVATDMMSDHVQKMTQRDGDGRSADEIVADMTAQNPQLRIIQPEEIAAAAVFVCREEAFGLSMDNIKITGGALW